MEHLGIPREGHGRACRLAAWPGRGPAFVRAQVVTERVTHRQALDDQGVFYPREKLQLVEHLLAGQ